MGGQEKGSQGINMLRLAEELRVNESVVVDALYAAACSTEEIDGVNYLKKAFEELRVDENRVPIFEGPDQVLRLLEVMRGMATEKVLGYDEQEVVITYPVSNDRGLADFRELCDKGSSLSSLAVRLLSGGSE